MALIFAGIAVKWAKAAAESADEQAKGTRTEVRVAEEQLEVQRRELARAQADAAETARVTAETRIDALAPEVFAWAQSGGRVETHEISPTPQPFLAFREREGGQWTEWKPVRESMKIESEKQNEIQFRVIAWLTFRNVSDRVARITIESPGFGSVEADARSEFIVLPQGVERGQSADTLWTLEVSPSWIVGDGVDHPSCEIFMRIEYAVRDLGGNSCDRFAIHGDLRFFREDGFRLVVEPQPSYPWTVRNAEFIAREYEALTRAASGSDA